MSLNTLSKIAIIALTNFVLLPAFGQSQMNITNAILANKEANIVYIGIQNPITIESAVPADVEVIAQKAKITTGTSGVYIAMPTTPGLDSFHILQHGKIIMTKVFRAEYLPPLTARIAGIFSNSASVAEVVAAKKLVSTAGETLLNVSNPILSYTVTIESTDATINGLQIENRSNVFTKEAIAIINQLKPGDKLSFKI